jgi:hypothetical protein
MVSTTADLSVAERFGALRQATGEELVPETLTESIPTDASLEYPFGENHPTGPVFKANQMEVKWDVYCFDDLLLFSSSWTGDLIYGARLAWGPGSCRITHVLRNVGVDSGPLYAIRTVDFLLKSHVYGLGVPHPLREIDDSNVETLALASFAAFGNRAWFGTFHDTLHLPAVHDALWADPQLRKAT